MLTSLPTVHPRCIYAQSCSASLFFTVLGKLGSCCMSKTSRNSNVNCYFSKLHVLTLVWGKCGRVEEHTLLMLFKTKHYSNEHI